MEMKRLFAYLIAALMLSLLLCGCGGTMDDGNVLSVLNDLATLIETNISE